MRFLLALLTTLSMLHLTLVGSDFACASQEAGAHAMTMGASAVVHGHSGVQDKDDCAMPTQAHCCDAIGSCSVQATVSPVKSPAAERLIAALTPRLPSAMLESVLVAPDPPPPKA